MIICDSREPDCLRELVHHATDGDTKTLLIPTADYIIEDQDGCKLGVERKTISDFLSSFSSGRLAKQLNRLKQDFMPVLLIEGTYALTENMRIRVGPRHTHWHHAAFQMALFSFMRDGIIVMRGNDHRATADVLRILNVRASKGCVKHGGTPILDVWPNDQAERLAVPKLARKPKRTSGKPELTCGSLTTNVAAVGMKSGIAPNSTG